MYPKLHTQALFNAKSRRSSNTQVLFQMEVDTPLMWRISHGTCYDLLTGNHDLNSLLLLAALS